MTAGLKLEVIMRLANISEMTRECLGWAHISCGKGRCKADKMIICKFC